MTIREKEGAALYLRASESAREIRSIFDDAARWNRLHPNEEPIDVDSDGQLRAAMERAMDIMLATDPAGQGKPQ